MPGLATGKQAVAEAEASEQSVSTCTLQGRNELANTGEVSANAQESDTGQAISSADQPGEDEMEEEAKELGLPSPRTLGPGSDFKAFMASDVPDHLRRFALRRLWRSNPVLANVDGLVDYGEDFTDAGTVIEGMKTAYQVGKGYFREAADTDPDEEGDLPRDDGTEYGAGDGIEDNADDGDDAAKVADGDAAGDDVAKSAGATPPGRYAAADTTTHAVGVTKT